MAIALDTNTYGASDATTTTVGITVANNSNRVLIALISLGNSTGISQVDSVTFNTSEAFTRAVTIIDDGTDAACDIWYLINPTATTADVVVDYDGGNSPDAAVNVVSLYGADQTDPIGARGAATGSSTTPQASITKEDSNSWVLAVISYGGGGAGVSGTPNSTEVELQDTIGGSGAGDYNHISGYSTSLTTLRWNMSDSGSAWAMLMAEVKPTAVTGLSVSVNDSITVTESKGLIETSFVNLTETITITESRSTQLIVELSVSDTISITESTQFNLISDITKSETITLSENIVILVTEPDSNTSLDSTDPSKFGWVIGVKIY